MTETTPTERETRTKARRNLTFLVLFSIVMIFASLLSAYVVSKGGASYWVHIHMPPAFYWSTGLILLSSVFVQLALMAARKGNTQAVPGWLIVGLVLGIGFTISQWKGWGQLHAGGQILSFSNVLQPKGTYGVDYTVEHKGLILQKVDTLYYAGDDVDHSHPLNAEMQEYVNGASQYFYVLTAAHVAHVAFGLLSLVIMVLMAVRGRYTAQDHVGLWAGTLYWHFLAGLWVVLLSFLAFVH